MNFSLNFSSQHGREVLKNMGHLNTFMTTGQTPTAEEDFDVIKSYSQLLMDLMLRLLLSNVVFKVKNEIIRRFIARLLEAQNLILFPGVHLSAYIDCL